LTIKHAVYIIAIASKLKGEFRLQLNDYIGFIFNNASRKLNQFAVSFFKSFDITPEQAGVIRRLGEQEGISQKELSIRMAKDQTNITRLLDQLERKELIERNPNKEDRRSFLIHLTGKGKEMHEKIKPVETAIMEIAMAGISEEKKSVLRETIDEILSNIENHNKI
jgi:DNA-binding MarR family transcriptional regulator